MPQKFIYLYICVIRGKCLQGTLSSSKVYNLFNLFDKDLFENCFRTKLDHFSVFVVISSFYTHYMANLTYLYDKWAIYTIRELFHLQNGCSGICQTLQGKSSCIILIHEPHEVKILHLVQLSYILIRLGGSFSSKMAVQISVKLYIGNVQF